jgi:hypothetical protein
MKTFRKIKKMEHDKFLPPKFSDAMKDLADLLQIQNVSVTEHSADISRMGLTSLKSDAGPSSHMLLNDTSPKFTGKVHLP